MENYFNLKEPKTQEQYDWQKKNCYNGHFVNIPTCPVCKGTHSCVYDCCVTKKPGYYTRHSSANENWRNIKETITYDI